MNPARGSLLSIEHLEAAEIMRILKFARRMNPEAATVAQGQASAASFLRGIDANPQLV